MKQRIKADLEKLHEEIQWLDDERSRNILDALVDDLQSGLAEEDHEQGQLREQVEAAATHFEADHPAVASILRNILATLGNMGI